MLTPEMIQGLRKPFAADAVKWKVQTNPRDEKNMALVVAFIDARDAAERLDAVTGGDWSDDYASPVVSVEGILSVECSLTIAGVTRKDVGSVTLGEKPGDNEDAVKAVYSDAFKRAALKFGVNAPMYRYPTVWARVEQKGRSWMLTDESKRDLAELTTRLCEDKDIPKFSNLWVFGGTAPAQPVAQQKPQQAASFAAPAPALAPPQRNRPTLLVETPSAQPQRAARQSAPPASDLQKRRIVAEIRDSRAGAQKIDELGGQFGIAALSSITMPEGITAPLTIARASMLISALAELSQRSARAA